MQSAETVLDVLRERGRKSLPLEGIYRQLFNPQLYLRGSWHRCRWTDRAIRRLSGSFVG
jgi:hypothetical protein